MQSGETDLLCLCVQRKLSSFSCAYDNVGSINVLREAEVEMANSESVDNELRQSSLYKYVLLCSIMLIENVTARGTRYTEGKYSKLRLLIIIRSLIKTTTRDCSKDKFLRSIQTSFVV